MNYLKGNLIPKGLCLFLLLGIQGILPAQDTLSLSQCLYIALDSNLSLQKERLLVDQAAFQALEQKSQFLPQVEGGLRWDLSPEQPTTVVPGSFLGRPEESFPLQFGREHTLTAEVHASQKVFSPQWLGAKDAQQSQQQLIQLRIQQAEEQVLYQVSKIYLEIQQNQFRLELLDSSLLRLQRLKQLTQFQYEQDLLRKADVAQIDLRRNSLNIQRRQLNQGIAQQKRYLALLMGLNPEREIELFVDFPLSGLLAAGGQAIPANRVEAQMLVTQNELLLQESARINRQGLPELEALLWLGLQAQRDRPDFLSSDPWYRMFRVSLQMTVPIYQGGKRKIAQQQLAVKARGQALSLQQFEQGLALEEAQANAQLRMHTQNLKDLKENQSLAADLYQKSVAQYREGLLPLQKLLEIKSQWSQVENEYLSGLIQQRLYVLESLKAQGKLRTLL